MMNETEKLNILLVDDRQENLLALEALLESADLNIIKAHSGHTALALMLAYDFALVLLDVQMPDMDGFETASLIRGSERTKHIPIIFITAISKDKENVFKGYESGAVDYLFKPVEPEILKSKVQVFIELHRQSNALKKTAHNLQQSIEEQKRINEKLRQANQKILEQHKSVIEEERLKVLLQIAGATAHELNQPLMTLLGSIELMRLNESRPEKFAHYLEVVEEAGGRISEIVKKISNIHQDSTLPYAGGTFITNLDQDINILALVDPKDFENLKNLLKGHKKVNLDCARNCIEAMKTLQARVYHAVFLDYLLPDGNGLDFIRSLNEAEVEIPVVVITGHGNEMIASQAIQAGAYDYLPKEMVSEKSLSRSINNVLGKFRLKRELKMARAKMAEMSIRDELTGLHNRRYFIEVLEREMARAKRYETPLVLCILDLDYFKQVNDTYGHPAGDLVLSEMGRMLKEHLRQSDLACRYGGEEFGVVLPNTLPDKAFLLCERFREIALQHQFNHNHAQFHVTLSIGITSFSPADDQFPSEFIERADQALYQAKREGRNRVKLNSLDRMAS